MSVKVYNLTAAGLLQTPASIAATAGINIPHGAAPTTPVNGDVWSTTTGFFVRVNGATVGPLGAAGLSNPMTTLGDIITGGASGAPTRLAGDTSNANRFLRSVSAAGIAAAPTWVALTATDIPNLSTSYVDLTTAQNVAGIKTFTANPVVNTGSNAGNATVGNIWIGDAGATNTVYNGPTLAGGGLVGDRSSGVHFWSSNGTTNVRTAQVNIGSWATIVGLQALGGFTNFTGIAGSATVTMPTSGATSFTPVTDVTPITIKGSSAQTADLLSLQNNSSVVQAKITADGSIASSNLNSKNRLINGELLHWQRGTTTTGTWAVSATPTTPVVFASATHTYLPDRWFGLGGTGSVNTLAQGVWGATTPYADCPPFYMTWNRTTAGTVDSILASRIEDVHTLAGKTITLSWWMSTASGSVDVKAALTQFFGTGGTSATPGTQSAVKTATTTATQFSYTFTVPSISGKTIVPASSFLEVQIVRAFNATNGATGAVNIWDLKLEVGSAISAPDRRDYQEELARCQRYYKRWVSTGTVNYIGNGVATTTVAVTTMVRTPVSMRVAPTGGISATTVLSGTPIVNAMTASAPSAATVNTPDIVMFGSTCGATTQGFAFQIFLNVAAAWIDANAEM